MDPTLDGDPLDLGDDTTDYYEDPTSYSVTAPSDGLTDVVDPNGATIFALPTTGAVDTLSPSSDGLNASDTGSSGSTGIIGSILSGVAKVFGAVSTNNANNALLQARANQLEAQAQPPSLLSALGLGGTSTGGISMTTLLLIGGVLLLVVAEK